MHVHVDGVKNFVEIVIAMLFLVEIRCNELERGISRAAPHAAQTCIDHNIARGALKQFAKSDRQRERQLLIVMRVKAQFDRRVKLRVEQTDNALKIVGVHRAKGVDHRE